MRRAVIAIVSLALLGAAKATPLPSAPDANGWSVLEKPGACALYSQGNLAFVASDGQRVALMSPGAIGGPKAFSVDAGRFEVTFTADSGVVVAPATDDMLVRLLQTDRIKADWPDGTIDTKPPLMSSLALLRACGARVAAAKAEAEARIQKRREFAARLARAGEILSDEAPRSASGSAMHSAPKVDGGACFKRREWTSGFNKTCVYDCTGSEAVQTIGSVEICPLMIDR